jgi:hypothetical protein
MGDPLRRDVTSAPFAAHETIVLARHLHLADHATHPRRISVDAVRKRYAGRSDYVAVEEHGEFSRAAADKAGLPKLLPGAESWVSVHPGTKRAIAHHAGLIGVDAQEANKLGLRGGEALSAATQQKVHSADGALVYNHPEFPNLDALNYVLPKSEAEAVDAVEVFNDVGITHEGNDALSVLAWVERNFYARGLFPALVGGQDEHADTVLTKRPSLTYVQTAPGERGEHALMQAIRGRATYVSRIGACDLGLDVDGTATLGASVSFKTGSDHTARLQLHGLPPGARVELRQNGVVIGQKTAGKDGDGSVAATFTADQAGWIDARVIVIEHAADRLALVTSPIPYTVR